jgi:carbonic anhydrase
MRIQRLVAGVHHFQKEVFRPEEAFFRNLARGQTPETLFITCADSRVNPNLLTQTAPGELFLLRNLGNVVPAYHAVLGAEAAAIEFAVRELQVKDIIICGHTYCGAMQALMAEPTHQEQPALQAWLQHAQATRAIMHGNYQHLQGDPLWRATIKENVLVQLEHLRSHPAVAEALEEGRVLLHGWVYHLEDGAVTAYDPVSGQFREVGQTSGTAEEPVAGP